MSKKSVSKDIIEKVDVIDEDVVVEKKSKSQYNSSWISDACQGALLGFGGVAYGSSASLISNWYSNPYESVISRLTGLFKKTSLSNYFKNFLSLGIFMLTALVVFMISYVVYAEMNKAGYAMAASFLFIGLNLFSIPMLFLIKRLKPKLAFSSQQFASYERPKFNWIIFAILFLIIFSIAFVARYAWSTDSYPTGLININQYNDFISSSVTNINESIYASSNLDTSYILQILFGAFLCGFAAFIPGLSGSYLLNVVGVNTDINIAVQYGFGGYNSGIEIISNDWAWPVIVISFIGVLAGIVASLFTMNYLLKNQRDLLNIGVLAISLASFIAILISFNEYEYIVLSSDKGLLGASVALFFVSIIPVFGTLCFFQKKKIINSKYLSFIK